MRLDGRPPTVSQASRNLPDAPGPKSIIPDKAIEDALLASNGRVGKAAELLGITATTIYRRLQEVPSVRRAKDAGLLTLVESAESELSKLVEEGDKDCILFVLRSRGGWNDKGPAGNVTLTQVNVGEAKATAEEKINEWRAMLGVKVDKADAPTENDETIEAEVVDEGAGDD